MVDTVEVKILLVDDAPANLLALEAVLDPLHYDIVKAHSGFEALEILQTTDISLVILDVQMPVMDGFETARLIKEKLPWKNIPIIFMTAIYKEDPYIRKGYEVGGVDYFGKPFDPAVLKAKVRLHAELYRQSQLLQRMEKKLEESERRNGHSGTEPAATGPPGPQPSIFIPDTQAAVTRYQVRDVDRSLAFYTRHLGFQLVQKAGPVFATISRGDLHLLLSGPESSGSRPMPDGRRQEPGGWNRIVLYVESLDATSASLRAAGAKFRNGVEKGPGGRQLQVEDPDGNPVELHEAPAK